MGVTIIGGGGGGSSTDDLGLPKFTGRFKLHSPYQAPTSFVAGSSVNYSTVGLTASKPNNAYAPKGNPKQYDSLIISTHNGTCRYRTAAGTNYDHPLSELNGNALSWIGGMWLTSGNILWAGTDNTTNIYIKEYDTSTQSFISSGIDITATNSGHSGAAGSNENTNKFGVLPDGNYYVGRNGKYDYISPAGSILHTSSHNGTAIPVNLYDSIDIRELGFYVRRLGHPTKPDVYYTATTTTGGRSLLPSIPFQGYDGTFNPSSAGSVYDGYIALTERCMIHQGDLSDWVSSVLDAVTGETT